MTAPSANAPGSVGGQAGRGRRALGGVRYAILATTAVCLLLSGCTMSTTGRPVAAPNLGRWQTPRILNARLDHLLLTAGDVDAVG